MPEDHERISMEEQRRIHTRALSKSGHSTLKVTAITAVMSLSIVRVS
jgi:hypothetical protein